MLKEGNDIGTVLGLLETGEDHLGTGDVLLGVLKVVVDGLVIPLDGLLGHGGGVRETLVGSGLTGEETVEVGSDLVGSTGVDNVALGATGLEELGSVSSVSCSIS